MKATVIGAGLAGCEAAYYLARHGVEVELHEMKPERFSPAHVSENFAELVCSNSLKSDDPATASGMLKTELRMLGSVVLSCADVTSVPAGGALAVDREAFSAAVTERVSACGNITVVRREATEIPEGEVIIATGPLTSDAMAKRIEALTGKQAEEAIYLAEDTMKEIRSMFNNTKDLATAIQKYISENAELKKEVEQFQAQMVERTKAKLLENVREVNGVKVISAVLPMEPAQAKDLVFKLRQALPEQMVAVIGSVAHDKPMISVMITDDLVSSHNLNAGKIVREAAKLIQGGGGGQAYYAQAGGKNADGLSAAVDKVVELCQL